jgi:hypothetical protein
MTLLEIIQAVVGETGVSSIPNQVVGNTDVQIQQLLYLANSVGSELSREYNWQALNRPYQFYTNFLITTGDIVDGSPVITNIPDTSTLSENFMVTGTGIANQSVSVLTVDSPTQVTLNTPCNVTENGVTLNFGQTRYPMPSDYDRQIDRTHYDKSKRWEMLGPETPQQWEFLRSSYISTGPRIRYRIMDNYFQIWPITTTNELLSFEYVSKSWVENAIGVPKSKFTEDDDTCIYPERLIINGIKLRLWELKGFDTVSFYRDFINQLQQAKSNDSGSATLSMSPKISTVLIGCENIPDGTIYGQGG